MTMSTKSHRSNAERLGRWLGGMWRGYARRERQAAAWLIGRGVPAGGAAAVLWIFKFGVLVILFYVAFWLALLAVFAVATAWGARNSDWDGKPDLEWREGHGGFGLYDKNEWRHDPGDPDKP
ncbi:TPA: DUF3742 family protein [Pseudomonas aeruginosa]|jgi:hypothetical protein|uniref:DUF3742 family protein n=2 Tax=Pseudomonadota TaxID=1224 RepID=UPI000455BBC1|nr:MULTISPECIES: DUF3742 family protein [Pseudomonadota]EIU1410641.1 DUF3742 family protein [Pseudomonas aeruginosa]EKU7419983.1 DUF3742 family protein [Pseudomonas aeruginosa]KSD37550.1 hypothetical protein AO901_21270 [Pseudomonas aeruginosa]KSE15435.1 hypothetical protein AO922_21220 [Pseudomonas aeruginosa]MBH8711725.1 DUF3742 family protein [Pseudomonas aeruginosa]